MSESQEQFNFKFGLDDMVVTPFGIDGIITMLGFDGDGRKYYVQTESNSDWYKEKMLTGVVSPLD